MRNRPLRVLAPSLVAAGAPLLLLGACHLRAGPVREEASIWSARAAMAPSGTFHLRSMNGKITVRPSSDGQLHVNAAARWRKGNPHRDIGFQQISSGQDVTVCAIWGRGECDPESNVRRVHWWDLVRGRHTDASIDFSVSVPAGVEVDVSTMNGAIDILATAPVRASTTNGGVKVGTSVGPVYAVSVNGNVDARMTTLGGAGPVHVMTVNGSAVAYVPPIDAGEVSLTTVNGSVGSDFGGAPAGETRRTTSLSFMLGQGGRAYKVVTVNGSAWLRRINTDGTIANVSSPPR